MPLHSSLAADARLLKATAIAKVEGEVSFIRVSRDGDLIAVVYDYQNFGGNPDIERIPDNTAVGLHQKSTGQWILKQTIASPIGGKVYGMREAEVVGLEAPHDLILSRGNQGATTLVRFSLADGREVPCVQPECAEEAQAFARGNLTAVPKRLQPVIAES